MYDKEKWSMGNIIRDLREEQGITLSQLCYGLCSIPTMNRIEMDNRDIGIQMANRIFQRLGYASDMFELYGSIEEFEQYEQRITIEKWVRNGDFESAETELIKYKNKWKKWIEEDNLQKQFVKYMEGRIAISVGNIEEGIEIIRKAITITFPMAQDNWSEKAVIGEDELIMLNALADGYELNGKRVEAYQIRRETLNYIEKNKNRKLNMIEIFTNVICKMVPSMLDDGAVKDCLDLCDQGLQVLSSDKRLYHYPELIYWKAMSLEKFYEGKDVCVEVAETFKKAYYMYDLFGDLKMAEMIRIHMEEKYKWECIK